MATVGTIEVMRIQKNLLTAHTSELACLARIIGELGDGPVTTGDRAEAERILSSLYREDEVRSAVFFDSEGAPFATYDRDGCSPARVPVRASLARSDLTGDYLTHTRGLKSGGLWIARDVSSVRAARKAGTKTLVLAALAILALSTLWSRVRKGLPLLRRKPKAKAPRERTKHVLGLAPKSALPSSHGLRSEQDEHHPRTVLLVEDNILNQRVAAKLLADMDYSCKVASDGVQALEVLEQHSIDVILMDCHMPKLDGWETTQCIRQSEADNDRHMPIIAMTAVGTRSERKRCVDAGMDDFVAKPIKPEDLQETLNRWMPASRQSEPAATAGIKS